MVAEVARGVKGIGKWISYLGVAYLIMGFLQALRDTVRSLFDTSAGAIALPDLADPLAALVTALVSAPPWLSYTIVGAGLVLLGSYVSRGQQQDQEEVPQQTEEASKGPTK